MKRGSWGAVVILGVRILSCRDASRPRVTGPAGHAHLLKQVLLSVLSSAGTAGGG